MSSYIASDPTPAPLRAGEGLGWGLFTRHRGVSAGSPSYQLWGGSLLL